jgi:hypothetical protein
MRDGVRALDAAVDAFPRRFSKLRLMVDVEQFVGLRRVQIEAVAADKLERVPRLRVVARRDRDAARGPQGFDGELQTRRRADAEVNHLAARCEQASEHRRVNHWPRGARVAADEDAPGVEVATEGLREPDRQFRREGLADDPAHAADADLERVH